MTGALTLISRRQWLRHKLRLLLTALGIALGVAVFFAILTTNSTLISSLRGTIEDLAGRATLQLSAGDSGFSEDYLDVVRSTPGVADAEPVSETIVHTTDGRKLLVLGLDTGSELKLYSDLFDAENYTARNPIAFSSHADSVAVSEDLATRMGLSDGSNIAVRTQGGDRDLTVRALFGSMGIGQVFGGNAAVMDIYGAQSLFGKSGRLDRIDIVNAPDVSVDELSDRLRSRLPAAIKVTRPSLRGKNLENSVSTLHFGLEIMSVLAFIVCGFLIFNSFSISLNQRRREIGILRSLGTERRSIQLMFLAEALILAVIGSTFGIGLGYLFAEAAMTVVSDVSMTVYGFAASPGSLEFSWTFAAQAFAIGVASSLIAAWLPARSAARLDPINALHHVETNERPGALNIPRIVAGVALVVVGLLLTTMATPMIGANFQLFYALLIQIGMILLLPLIIRWGGRILRAPMNKLFGAEGLIAVETMVLAPRRTASTVGALMVGVAFVFSTAAFVASQKTALSRSIDKALDADVLITSSDQLQASTYHFSPETRERILAIPGIAVADPLRVASTEFRGETVSLLAHDMRAYFEISPDLLDIGDRDEAMRSAAGGHGVLISNNFAFRWDVELGDNLRIDAPGGSFELPVVGMLNYYRSEVGTVFIDRSVYRQYWDDDTVDYILIDLVTGTNVSQFRQQADLAISSDPNAFIYTHEEFKSWVGGLIDQFFTLMYLQMVVAMLVAALGLANTMIISVDERTRELGVFRAIGGLRRQVVKMVLLEAVAISLIGMGAASIFGVLNAYFLVNTAAKVVAGFTIHLVFPYSIVLMALPLVLTIAVLSALFPAIKASRLRVPEAIGYE